MTDESLDEVFTGYQANTNSVGQELKSENDELERTMSETTPVKQEPQNEQQSAVEIKNEGI